MKRKEPEDPKWGHCECPHCGAISTVQIPFTGNCHVKYTFKCRVCQKYTAAIVINYSRMELLHPFSEARNERINKQREALERR